MNTSLIQLRKRGVRLDIPHPREPKDIPKELLLSGILEYAKQTQVKGRGKCLLLRDYKSTPGYGVFCELYQPQIFWVDEYSIKVRGFEAIEVDGVMTTYMQEWCVFPQRG